MVTVCTERGREHVLSVPKGLMVCQPGRQDVKRCNGTLSQTRHCPTSCSSCLYDQDQAVTEDSVGPTAIEAVVVSVNVNININADCQVHSLTFY
jgi:hypothetical protein